MLRNIFLWSAFLAFGYVCSFVGELSADLVPENKVSEAEIQDYLNHAFEGTDGKITEEEKKEIEKSGTSATYGEMKVEGCSQIISRAEYMYPEFFHDEENVIFFDIGSGRALVPMMFALKKDFKKFCGIEISESRHKEGELGLAKLVKMYPKHTNLSERIKLINSDIFKVDLQKLAKEANPKAKGSNWFIWISSLCFPEEIMEKLVPKLEKEVPDGSIIYTSKALPVKSDSRIQLIEVRFYQMTWTKDSRTHLYIVDKKNSPLVQRMRHASQGEEAYGFIEKRLSEPVMQPQKFDIAEAMEKATGKK